MIQYGSMPTQFLEPVKESAVESALPFIDLLPYPVLWIEPGHHLRFANRSARAIYGEGKDTCHELTHGYQRPCHLEGEACPKLQAEDTGQPAAVAHSHVTEWGNRLFMVLAVPVENGDIMEFHIELTDGVSRDELTQLHARPFFEQMARRELALLERMKLPYGLIFIDLDRFKQINDDNGHQAGDAALRQIGAAIRHTLRDSDLAGRWGGEEFCLFLPGSDRAGTLCIGRRLRDAIRRIRLAGPWAHVRVTASIGVYSGTEQYDFERAVDAADRSMYQAKALGRNRVEHTDPPEADTAIGR